MYKRDREREQGKPYDPEFRERGPGYIFISCYRCIRFDKARPDIGDEDTGCRMHAGGIGEHIDTDAGNESKWQQYP